MNLFLKEVSTLFTKETVSSFKFFLEKCQVFLSSFVETSEQLAAATIQIVEQPNTSRIKNNYYPKMCSGSEEGSYSKLTDFRIIQL